MNQLDVTNWEECFQDKEVWRDFVLVTKFLKNRRVKEEEEQYLLINCT